MTLFELKQDADATFAKIEDAVHLDFFTLNKELQPLYAHIDELQKQCAHEFVNGKCKYCRKDEK